MIRHFVVLMLSLHALAAGHLLFRFQLETQLLQKQGHRSLSHNYIPFNMKNHLTRVKLQFSRARRMLLQDLYRLNRVGIHLESKISFIAQHAGKIFGRFMIIFKRFLFLVSWLKLLSLALWIYVDARTKMHQISEISASLTFIAGFVNCNGKIVMANAEDFLNLVSLGLFCCSMFLGCYFFALALVFAQYHRHTIKVGLDTLIEHVDE